MSKALMIQGTGSHVGKSLLVAALCRIFRRRGFRVAPFKAQNMALNAHVTADGKEMARAQATQAEAAGIAPTVEMNPVLLKATSHTSAQVILMGKAVGNMGVMEYRAFKSQAWEVICEAYRNLSKRHDLIVIEGAGSPAEINLKSHEIVNMRVAEMADARVLLAGDIDRGGVFAAIVGTMELLAPGERARVAGFIINKFRGDAALLKGGIDFLEARLGKKVLGVVPYLEGLDLPEEDGVALQENAFRDPSSGFRVDETEKIKIGVVRLPHISNFTDFDPFRGEPEAELIYVERPSEIGRELDLLILPGTKQTLSDLFYLREKGFDAAIRRYHREGGKIAGICGGYQLLGETVSDPKGIEGPSGSAPGLGLLPVETLLEEEKRLVQIEGTLLPGACALWYLPEETAIRGYEIHMGRTRILDGRSSLFRVHPLGDASDARPDGVADGTGSVWGSYLHGLFDNDLFRLGFLSTLRASKGDQAPSSPEGLTRDAKPETRNDYSHRKESAFDRLADAVESALDMKAIHDLL